MMWNGMGPPMLFLTLTSGIFLLALLAGGGYLIWKANGTQSRSSADTVLAERYARGEIDETEYRQRLTTLHTP